MCRDSESRTMDLKGDGQQCRKFSVGKEGLNAGTPSLTLSIRSTRYSKHEIHFSSSSIHHPTPHSLLLFLGLHQLAPSVSRAPLSSLIAVGTSSKFSADMAHRACFCAFMTACSSTTTSAAGAGAGAGAGGATWEMGCWRSCGGACGIGCLGADCGARLGGMGVCLRKEMTMMGWWYFLTTLLLGAVEISHGVRAAKGRAVRDVLMERLGGQLSNCRRAH